MEKKIECSKAGSRTSSCGCLPNSHRHSALSDSFREKNESGSNPEFEPYSSTKARLQTVAGRKDKKREAKFWKNGPPRKSQTAHAHTCPASSLRFTICNWGIFTTSTSTCVEYKFHHTPPVTSQGLSTHDCVLSSLSLLVCHTHDWLMAVSSARVRTVSRVACIES